MLLGLAGLGACSEPPAVEDKPLVVVSVPPQAYVVHRIAGDLVGVEIMLPPGANPVTHEPTIAQLRALSRASLYVKVGHPHFPFEKTWLRRVLTESAGPAVVDASAGVGEREGDPHVWVSPRHVRAMAESVATALTGLLPVHQAEIGANLGRFTAEIDALDVEIRELLRGARGRPFLVLHPAWGYLAREYGLEQIAIEREHKEPDPRELADRIARAKEAEIEVVFVQPQFDPQAAEVVAREIGGRVALLDPLAYDWADNLRRVARALAEGVGR